MSDISDKTKRLSDLLGNIRYNGNVDDLYINPSFKQSLHWTRSNPAQLRVPITWTSTTTNSDNETEGVFIRGVVEDPSVCKVELD